MKLRIRDASESVKTFAQSFNSNLAAKLDTHDLEGATLAHNLVAVVISSVCKAHSAGTAPSAFTPSVLQDCIKAVYDGKQIQSPSERFVATFGASILCSYVVSEAYPAAKGFAVVGCEELRELMSTTATKSSVAATNTGTSVRLMFFESPTSQLTGEETAATLQMSTTSAPKAAQSSVPSASIALSTISKEPESGSSIKTGTDRSIIKLQFPASSDMSSPIGIHSFTQTPRSLAAQQTSNGV